MTDDWRTDDARELYNLPQWGNGYVDINDRGNLVIRPRRDASCGEIDLHALVDEVTAANLSLPVLVRFTDILADRVDVLCHAFSDAMQAHEYTANYTAVYPIKVNQQRVVVETILSEGGNRVGLEAGSKPELMAVLGADHNAERIIVCNGYKDSEYIRLALIAHRIGHRCYIVIEKRSELEIVLGESERLGIEPRLGIRVRLASIAAGKWQNTGGDKSKFGLSATQVLAVIEQLRVSGKLGCLSMLHFHIGSQVSNIRDIQNALTEAAHYYTNLRNLGAAIDTVDVGGGLGVDYEGAGSRSFCSMNYSVTEYATNVVRTLAEVCRGQSQPCPNIITEAGRAMSAHHAVLLVNLIDHEQKITNTPPKPPAEDAPLTIQDLWQGYERIGEQPPIEAWHDAAFWHTQAQQMFRQGLLTLQQRAYAEQLYLATCTMLRNRLNTGNRAHRELLDELDEKLADQHFYNFSLFQSLPDVWAIDQVFPIVPLHRLNEAPTRRVMIQDLTCDSDGCIEHYVDSQGTTSTLALHDVQSNQAYCIGIFLTGAYQEILGDRHNLFGDTHAINVRLDPQGGHHLVQPHTGETVDKILRHVDFQKERLLEIYADKVKRAHIDTAQKKLFLDTLKEGLSGYSYLEVQRRDVIQ